MNKFLKYALISCVSFIVVLYAIFILVPFFLTGIINSYSDEISSIVEKSSGFKLKLENMQVLSTPKLTLGAKAGHLEAALPNGEKFFTVDNLQVKMSRYFQYKIS